MAHEIFISYRKIISNREAVILKSTVEARFGEGSVFLDKDDIQVGDKWEDTLKEKLNAAKIVLIIIGKNWTKCAWDFTESEKQIFEGQRRIDHPKDWVCREIQEASLAQKGIVVYMGGAKAGEVNPSALTNPKFPHVKSFFENSQQHICISENHHAYEFEQIHKELERRGLKSSSLSPVKSDSIRFDKKENHKLTEYDCYCCDRERVLREVRQFIQARSGQENHLHIFIPSLPADAPESFVTRIVYDKRIVESDFQKKEHRAAEPASHIKLFETPLDDHSEAQSIINGDIKTFTQQSYLAGTVVLFYKINLQYWGKTDCARFIDRIVRKEIPSTEGKRFLVFYWLDISGCMVKNNLWSRLTGKGIGQLEMLGTSCKGSNHICFTEKLPPVEKADLIEWFSHRCENHASYPGFVETLFAGNRQMHMASIEDHLRQSFLRTTYR